MGHKTGSLAAQLAELSSVAPTSYDDGLDSDPEARDAGRRREGIDVDDDDSEDGEEAKARSHARHTLYDVAPSKMRRQANFIESMSDEALRKYQGVRTTRKEMLGEDDGSDEDEAGEEKERSDYDDGDGDDDEDNTEDDEQGYGDEGSGEDDEEEDDDDDDSEASHLQLSDRSGEGETSLATSKQKRLRFSDMNDTSHISLPTAGTSAKAAEADAALLASLRQRTRQEAQRGRDARRQTDAWGKLLGVRIRAQKVFRTAGRVNTRAMATAAPTLQVDDKQMLDTTLASLDQLSTYLFQLQDRILRSYASTSAESDAVSTALDAMQVDLDAAKSSSSKERTLDDSDFNRTILTLDALHTSVFGPMWREILAKWSWRMSTTGIDEARKAKSRFSDGAAGRSSNSLATELKAVNQSAEGQIERGLTGDTFARLRKRTRVWRGSEKESRIGCVTSQDNDEANGVENDDEDNGQSLGAVSGEDADVFDDSDFYAALLRELIDGKASEGAAGADALDGSTVAWAQAAKRAAKKHRAVDHRASKGRRLRYDVHEKVENFMPPIPTETWSGEQIQRLVRQLRNGHGFSDDSQQPQEDEVYVQNTSVPPLSAVHSTAELGGLRLFG